MLEDSSKSFSVFHSCAFADSGLTKRGTGSYIQGYGNCEFLAHFPVMVMKSAVFSAGTDVWKR
jgi:hypothetical protein